MFEIAIALWNGHWLTAAITSGIVVLTLVPLTMARRFRVCIPAECELLAIASAGKISAVIALYQRGWR